MNREAQLGNQMMIFSFIIMIIILGAGLVTGILMFYGKKTDMREVDAQLLNTKLNDCIKKNEINVSDAALLESSLLEICDINQKVIEKGYFIEIKTDGEKTFRIKDTSLCELNSLNKEFPRCFASELVKDGSKISILTGAAQQSVEEVA